jgi:hypothetical protein
MQRFKVLQRLWDVERRDGVRMTLLAVVYIRPLSDPHGAAQSMSPRAMSSNDLPCECE